MFISVITLFLSSSITPLSAQIIVPQNNEEVSSTTPEEISTATSPAPKPFGVRVTSPSDGERIFVNGSSYFTQYGDKLTIEGFAVANEGNNLTDCTVSIITNSVFPYQVANGTGPLGDNDFSNWEYEFSNNYAHLKEGSNKITSKVTCQPGNVNAYYSVNVTGIKFNGTFASPPPSQNLAGSNETNPTDLTISNNTNDIKTDIPLRATGIVITSPSDGTQIDLDNPILVNGTSTYPLDYNCEVQVADGSMTGVIVPNSANQSIFKKATPLGNNGTTDYRTWSMVLDPENSNLKNGSQSLTAKLQCFSPMSSVKFAKVNIIGLSSEPVELKSLLISIDKSGQGINQRIIFSIADAINNTPIQGAKLSGMLNDDTFAGTTDPNGKYTITIPENVLDSASTVSVSVTVTADGYKSKKSTTSFEIASQSNAESTIEPEEENIRNEDLADQIFSDVQEQLSRQGINIPLPFG